MYLKTASILVVLLLALSQSSGYAHWEDPSGCAKAHEHISGLQDEWDKLYDGVSEDGRDYIYRWKHKHSTLITEEHFILLPPSQWEKPDEPEHIAIPISEWIDWDGDGTYSEWYLFPRGKADCKDALHFIWSNQSQTYVLYATGKERT